MKGDIAFSGFMFTAEQWLALDPDTRAMLEDIETAPEHELRRFPSGTEPPPVPPPHIAEGSGKFQTDDYIDLFSDDLDT